MYEGVLQSGGRASFYQGILCKDAPDPERPEVAELETGLAGTEEGWQTELSRLRPRVAAAEEHAEATDRRLGAAEDKLWCRGVQSVSVRMYFALYSA